VIRQIHVETVGSRRGRRPCRRQEDEQMMAGDDKTNAEAEIRALFDHQARAISAKDVDGSVASYAADVLLFDVVNPLQRIGSDAARKRLAEWFASFQGPIGYDLRDLAITAGEDVAFCHSMNRVVATTAVGQKLDMWWRTTVCCRKVDGAWMVVHEHASVPFDAETGRASLGLEP
jgi:uncharacterized protein (TIGR02246 family)